MNITDYVESEFSRFEDRPFCEVDSLVLCQFIYMCFKSIVPNADARKNRVRIADVLQAEHFESMLEDVRDPDGNRRLLYAMSASPRFRDVELTFYVDEVDYDEEMQFCAMTAYLTRKEAYVVFRGTDATLVGWKEDFNMTFSTPVPAQERAASYINKIAKHLPKTIYVGGHSKGGNLAVYAAMNARKKVRKKITAVFDHDGPGFVPQVLDGHTGYAEIQGRIRKTMPEAAFVGILLENRSEYSIVKSSRFGIMQHDPFSWEIENNEFECAEKMLGISEHSRQVLKSWLETIDNEQRKLFIDTIYEVISGGEEMTLPEYVKNWASTVPKIIDNARKLDPEVRDFVLKTIKELAIISISGGKK